MAKQTSKDQLLIDICSERRRLEKNLSALSVEALTQPGVTGSWSVKDILAHLVAWERLFLEWYQAGLQGCAPTITPVGMSKKAIDALNQEVYEQNRARSLDEILTEFHTSYRQTLATIEGIPEEDMFLRDRFDWTGKYMLADYIAGNTCNHYAWANSQVRKWVKRQSGEN